MFRSLSFCSMKLAPYEVSPQSPMKSGTAFNSILSGCLQASQNKSLHLCALTFPAARGSRTPPRGLPARPLGSKRPPPACRREPPSGRPRHTFGSPRPPSHLCWQRDGLDRTSEGAIDSAWVGLGNDLRWSTLMAWCSHLPSSMTGECWQCQKKGRDAPLLMKV